MFKINSVREGNFKHFGHLTKYMFTQTAMPICMLFFVGK